MNANQPTALGPTPFAASSGALSDALAIVRDALAGYGSVPLSQSLRAAIRVARLLGDAENLWWLDWETRDLADEHSQNDILAEISELIPTDRANVLMTEFIARYRHERSVWSSLDISKGVPATKDKVLRDSVESIERRIRLSADVRPSLRWYDALFNRPQLGKQQIELTLTASHFSGVLDRISARVHAYLSRAEAAAMFSSGAVDLLGPHITTVNALLQDVAPIVLTMMTSVYRRLAEGDSEALSQAALSCRRVLKAVADVVQPASADTIIGLDGAEHDLAEGNYVNRLVAFIQATYRETEGAVEVTAVRDLARRLSALNDLASRGVHSDNLTFFEARQCALLTYIVAGDMLAHHRLD